MRRSRVVPRTAAPVALLLAGTLLAPGAVARPPSPLTARPDPAPLSALGLPDAAPAVVDEGAERALDVATATTPVAPGLVLQRRTTLDAAGPLRTSLLRLAPPGTAAAVRPQLLQQSLSAPRTPADLATAAGAVAAVNGDFFDIDRTGTPDGPVLRDGVPLKASAAAQPAVGVDATAAGWAGRLGDVLLEGSAELDGRRLPLAALGTRTVGPDALAAFGPAWGSGDRALTAGPGAVEVEVRAGRVTAVRSPGAVPVPADGHVLVATGTVAAALAGRPLLGTPSTVDVRVRQDVLAPGSTGFGLGARLELVRDGRVAAVDTADPTWAALRARTAIGWTATGELLLLTVDGGTARSRGTTAVETARLMVDAGAVGAVMLDGGGSAQLVARAPGDAGVGVVGEPSDGAPRPVANAVGLVPAGSDGRRAAVVLRPAGGGQAGDGQADGGPAGGARVFPGLRLAVEAVGTDAGGAPVPGPAASWRAEGSASVRATGATADVTGTAPGTAVVRADLPGAGGELAVQVLGPLRALALVPAPVLPAAGASVDVRVEGRDADGRTAPVRADDVRVDVDPALLRAEPLPDGRLRLTALAAGPTSTVVGTSAAGVRAATAVAVGLGTRPVDALADPARWSTATTRATAALDAVAVPDLPGTTSALRLRYDFRGQPAGTTVASVLPRETLALPAGTRRVALQVRGDGGGGWLRGVLRVDGADRPVTFAPRVDWTGWRRLEVDVPADARTVALGRIYLAQTDVARRTAGALDLARLDALVAPAAGPLTTGPADPAVADLPAGGTAVVTGTHVRAGDPGGLDALRRALSAARAAGAAHVLLLGGIVGPVGGRGSAADVDAVRAELARTLPAGTGWTWVPGPGEVATPAAAGPSSTGATGLPRRLDVAGTRYLLLDSASGSLRGDGRGTAQLRWLRAELAAAGADRVVVVGATAPDDLTDPEEAALLRAWTGELAGRGTGTGVVAASVGAVQVVRREGVLEVGAATGAGDAGVVVLGGDGGRVLLDPRPTVPVLDRAARRVR